MGLPLYDLLQHIILNSHRTSNPLTDGMQPEQIVRFWIELWLKDDDSFVQMVAEYYQQMVLRSAL